MFLRVFIFSYDNSIHRYLFIFYSFPPYFYFIRHCKEMFYLNKTVLESMKRNLKKKKQGIYDSKSFDDDVNRNSKIKKYKFSLFFIFYRKIMIECKKNT